MAPAALLHLDLFAVLEVGNQFRQMNQAASWKLFPGWVSLRQPLHVGNHGCHFRSVIGQRTATLASQETFLNSRGKGDHAIAALIKNEKQTRQTDDRRGETSRACPKVAIAAGLL